jgi:hypothetical protein
MSPVMAAVIKAAMLYVPDDELREGFYKLILPSLDHAKWHGHGDCFGIDPVYDAVILELYPQWRP